MGEMCTLVLDQSFNHLTPSYSLCDLGEATYLIIVSLSFFTSKTVKIIQIHSGIMRIK